MTVISLILYVVMAVLMYYQALHNREASFDNIYGWVTGTIFTVLALGLFVAMWIFLVRIKGSFGQRL